MMGVLSSMEGGAGTGILSSKKDHENNLSSGRIKKPDIPKFLKQ